MEVYYVELQKATVLEEEIYLQYMLALCNRLHSAVL